MEQVLLAALLAGASWFDLRTGKIPNSLNLAGALAGLVAVLLRLRFGGDPAPLLLGGVVAFAALLLLYLGGGVGGGDVKLGVGFGLLSGYPAVVRHLFFGGLAALVLILGRLAWRGEVGRGLVAALRRPTRPAAPGLAAAESRKPDRAGASVSFPLALLMGVVWVWIMRAL